jgi:hypothetical protein
MNQSTNYKHKIDFLISNDTSLSQPTETTPEPKKRKIYEKCNECKKRRRPLDESHQICHVCYIMKPIFRPSGNKIIDDFIKHTQINLVKGQGKMEFVRFDQFKNIEFIAEGGFSKIYKATWIDGPITQISWCRRHNGIIFREPNYTVVLKKLNNSKNITSKQLNEVTIQYNTYINFNKSSNKMIFFI